ncbi:MAG: hypothetical protein CML68_20455 [Rhodobacteraceae bacterium]|nr:hypothetical protein [Paracoccaceae bacterium]
MGNDQKEVLDQSLKTALWAVDLMVDTLPDMLARATALEDVARGRADFNENDAAEIKNWVEAMAYGFGVLRSSLADLRVQIPEDQG